MDMGRIEGQRVYYNNKPLVTFYVKSYLSWHHDVPTSWPFDVRGSVKIKNKKCVIKSTSIKKATKKQAWKQVLSINSYFLNKDIMIGN